MLHIVVRARRRMEPRVSDVDDLDVQPVATRALENRVHAATVVVVGDDDLVSGYEHRTPGAGDHAVGGVVHQRDFVDVRSDESRELVVQGFTKLGGVHVPPIAEIVLVDPYERFDLTLVDVARRRTPRSGVHVNETVAKEKLRRHFLPRALVIGRGCFWKRTQIGSSDNGGLRCCVRTRQQRCRRGSTNKAEKSSTRHSFSFSGSSTTGLKLNSLMALPRALYTPVGRLNATVRIQKNARAGSRARAFLGRE